MMEGKEVMLPITTTNMGTIKIKVMAIRIPMSIPMMRTTVTPISTPTVATMQRSELSSPKALSTPR